MPHPPRAGRAGRSSRPGRRPSAWPPRGRRTVVVGLTVALLAIGALAAAWHLPSGSQSVEPPAGYTAAHAALVASYEGRYPIKPRVWGSANGAADAEAKEAEPTTALAFAGEGMGRRLEAEAQIERDLSESLSPEARAAAGVRHLFNGTTDRAIAALEAARLERPDDPRILNDLAATYLTSGLEEERPLHLLESLEFAHRAVEIAPDHPEPMYNLALALDALQLRRAAVRQWGSFYQLDNTESPWATIAQERLEALQLPDAAEIWQERRSELRLLAGVGLTDEVRGIVEAYPEQALEEAERWLLEDWSLSVKTGDIARADEAIDSARMVAGALARTHGRNFLEAALEHASSLSAGRERLSLALAYSEVRSAIDTIERIEVAGVEGALERALPRLRALNSPYLHRSRYLLAICKYQGHNYDEARSLAVAAHEGAVAVHDSITILGTLQLLGIAENIALNYSASVDYLLSALDFAEAGNWDPSAAGIHGLIGEVFSLWGEEEGAWSHRLKALKGATTIVKSRIRVRIWSDAVLNTESEVAARYMVDELVSAATRAALPTTWAVALEKRASLLTELGEFELALDDLREAQRWIRQLKDESIADALLGNVLLREGSLLIMSEEPNQGLKILDAASDVFERTHYDLGRPWILRERARGKGAMGRLDEAAADLALATQILEAAGVEVEDPLRFARLAMDARPVYDEWLTFIAQTAAPEEALAVADRSRWLFRPPTQHPNGGKSWTSRLPRDVMVVAYHSLPDRLLMWTLRSDESLMTEVAIPRATLDSLSEELIRSIRWNVGVERVAVEVYELLIAPLEPALEGISKVIIVPDGPLFNIPFAVLRKSLQGAPLLARFELAKSLTVMDAIAKAGHREPPFLRNSSVLVLANPTTPANLRRSTLPGAELEAMHVREVFPNATVLTRAAASEASFMALAEGSDIVHVAAHGSSSARQPMSSHVLLMPGKGFDGSLFGRELRNTAFNDLRLVVLSVCGSDYVGEDLTFLASDFLASGADYVVSASRRVEDGVTAKFFWLFYAHLASGYGPGAALRGAQLQFMESDNASLNLPSAWATFELYQGV